VGQDGDDMGVVSLHEESLNLADQWILSRLNTTVEEARKAIDSYRFNEFAHHLYQFVWHEFCDWYIEMSKLSLNGTLRDDSAKTRRILITVLEKLLLLLHPLMPFVTEEIWQALTEKRKAKAREKSWSIMIQPYPEVDRGYIRSEVEDKVGFLADVIRAIRNLRTEMNCPPSKQVQVILFGADQEIAFLRSQEPYLRALARADSVEYQTSGERPKGAATAIVRATEIYLPLDGMVNLREERERLLKEIPKLERELARVQNKLDNRAFLVNAKEEVVEKEKGKLQEFEEKLQTLRRSLQRIQEMSEAGPRA